MTSGELFKKIAKQVHPDLNGGDSRFNGMMREALNHRNDVDVLIRLARKWGIDIGESLNNRESSNTYNDQVFRAIIGAIVNMSFSYKRKNRKVTGVITDIKSIRSKGYSGIKEYSVYDAITGSVWKVKSNQPTFRVVGMASDSQLRLALEGHRAINDSKQRSRRQPPVKRKSSTSTNTFGGNSFNLRPNRNYRGEGYRVMYETAKGLKYGNVLRTTAKCVVVQGFGQKESLIRIVKVRQVFKN
jgi:hypothetical protein